MCLFVSYKQIIHLLVANTLVNQSVSVLVLRFITKFFRQRKHNREQNLCSLSLLLRLFLYNRLRLDFLSFHFNHRSSTNIYFRSSINSFSFRQSLLLSSFFLLLVDCFSVQILNQSAKDGLVHRTCFNNINRRNVTGTTCSCAKLSALFLDNKGINTIHVFVNIAEHILNLHLIDCGNHIDTLIHLLAPVSASLLVARASSIWSLRSLRVELSSL